MFPTFEMFRLRLSHLDLRSHTKNVGHPMQDEGSEPVRHVSMRRVSEIHFEYSARTYESETNLKKKKYRVFARDIKTAILVFEEKRIWIRSFCQVHEHGRGN